MIAEFGHQADRVVLIAHGRVNKIGAGKYGNETMTGVLADGQYFGDAGAARSPTHLGVHRQGRHGLHGAVAAAAGVPGS